MADRVIKLSLSVQAGLDKDQAEYLVACVLYDNGVPIDPISQELTHGELQYTQVGGTRTYIWQGQDRRI